MNIQYDSELTMKSIFSLVIALLLLSVPAQADAQDLSDPETTLLTVPAVQRAITAIYKLESDGTLTQTRRGVGTMFCISDTPGDNRFSVSCHANTTFDLVEYEMMLRAEESENRTELIESAYKSGEVELPSGSFSFYASGAVNEELGRPETLRHWMEIRVPYATSADLGVTTENAGADPWMMGEGEFSAHIMIDYRPKSWAEFAGETITEASTRD